MSEVAPRSDHPGLAARRVAAEVLMAVLHHRRSLDEALGLGGALDQRDRALMRMLTATSLRRLGSLRALLAQYLEQGLPANVPLVEAALLVGATQLLFLTVPAHAAVDLSVQLVTESPVARRYAGLVNAVLRRIAADGRDKLAATPATADTPDWLLARWEKTYGAETAHAIAAAHQVEAALDLSVKNNAEQWAARLGGRVLPTGGVRLIAEGPVTALPGYAEGAWWVQDAAAALPARLLGDVKGMKVADLCAAPGGKTAQLVTAGADVVAVDRSAPRLDRLRENLQRLKLSAETVLADAGQWRASPFDAVLLDAPCSSTGTIRRHPDVPWVKRPADIPALAAVQGRLLRHAAELVRPGGMLIYATCSLEPEEGIDQVETFLAEHADFVRVPVKPEEFGGESWLISINQDIRTLPCHMLDSDRRLSGCDGFYAARLARR